jgi:hypothetical protein
MLTAAEYRQFAAECLIALRAATSPEVRDALLSMAKRWNDLADHIERNAQLLNL